MSISTDLIPADGTDLKSSQLIKSNQMIITNRGYDLDREPESQREPERESPVRGPGNWMVHPRADPACRRADISRNCSDISSLILGPNLEPALRELQQPSHFL